MPRTNPKEHDRRTRTLRRRELSRKLRAAAAAEAKPVEAEPAKKS